MSDALSDDIKTDFVNELKDYIPLLRDKAVKLSMLSPEASDTHLTELHRLIHAIRGASALIKLNNLSEVASEIETTVEAMMGQQLEFNEDLFNAINATIDYFDAYAKAVPCDDATNDTQRTEVLNTLRDLNSIASPDDGQDLLSQLLRGADQGEADGPIVFDASDLSFDAIGGKHEDFALTDDELADVVGHPPTKDAPVATEETPIDIPLTTLNTGSIEEPETIDLPHAELLEGFHQESEDHFQDLGKAIRQLEERIKTPTDITPEYKELLRRIRRSVHTVKGAAAVVKLKPIASWGHEFENILDWLYEKAVALSPEDINLIINATDVLENLVTAPQKVDPLHLDLLRIEFKRITGATGDAVPKAPKKESKAVMWSKPAEAIEVVLPEDDPRDPPRFANKNDKSASSLPADIVKTMRVDLAKVKSLVNLGGELTIALSAFDKDMENLGGLIGEIDRTQFRLKNTARDLELGYEGKAIGKLDAAPPKIENQEAVTLEEVSSLSEFDLLELDRYSELSLIIRSLSETAADAGTISQQLSNIHSGFKGYLHHLQILLSELNEKTMRMRMTPMASITNRMRRTVRETASQLNKKVHLTIVGEHIELDKLVWDKLADPLMHLLRNAIDHGVESETARRDAGKPETANIRLEAIYQGNQVVLRISDDGPGIDYDAIRSFTDITDADIDESGISQDELTEMIFQPGFSTRETISEVSGRGVGLDVVKENILELKGSVSVEESEMGIGTTFLIKLPLTMAVIKALIFDIRGRRYATALYDIKEILRVNPRDLTPQGDGTIFVGGRRLPYHDLSEILEEQQGPDQQAGDTTQWPLLLIVEKETWQGAVAIDRMYSQRDIVIKNLGNHLGQVKGIAGATVMGDGRVVPILNIEELIRVEKEGPSRPLRLKTRKKVQKPLEIMVVDDSVTIRNVVSRLMKRQGWNVLTAKDGMEAIEVLYTRQPDLVILDIEMPRMNGYEFMSSIRAQEKFNDLPVIMHTSRASKKHREKAASLGVNGFVTKPYEEEDFIALVKELGRKKTEISVDGALLSE